MVNILVMVEVRIWLRLKIYVNSGVWEERFYWR